MKKIFEGLKRLSALPSPLKAAYAKSGFDYFFPEFNLTKTLKSISVAKEDQVFAAVHSTLRDQTLLELRTRRAEANGMISDHELHLIHALVLLRRPNIVVETGVASGGSSAAILSALEKNGTGRLISIDLPCVKKEDQIVCFSGAYQFQPHETSTVSDFGSAGWLVPERLRSRWTFHLGDSLELLPQVVEETGTVDLFLHDSFHSYSHMKSEFEIIWSFLSLSGLLVADDIFAFGHSAFPDFARATGRNFLTYSGMGIIVK